jgi:pSer/pThr/pTyr-binding forkhead associated (FHA) protein
MAPGNQELTLTLPVEVPDTELPWDEMFSDTGPTAELALPNGMSAPLHGVTLIGRSPDCNLVIDDPTLGRHHAQIQVTDQGWWFEDLGSANGSFVNDVRIASAFLNHGDILTLGQIELGFRAR